MLRWSLSTTDESQMPLTINCWPEAEGGGQMNVSMEYELVRQTYCYVLPAGLSKPCRSTRVVLRDVGGCHCPFLVPRLAVIACPL